MKVPAFAAAVAALMVMAAAAGVWLPRPTGDRPARSPSPGQYATAAQAGAAGRDMSGLGRCRSETPDDALQVDSPTVAVFTYACGGAGQTPALLDVWVYRQGDAWHVFTWAAHGPAGPPGPDGVWMGEQPVEVAGGGCVAVYAAPGAGGPSLRCLGAGDYVVWASPHHQPWEAPVWANGTIWWYVFLDDNGEGRAPTPLGWMDAAALICGDGPRDLATACKDKVSPEGYMTAREAGDATARATGEIVDPNAYPGTQTVTGAAMAAFSYPIGPNWTGAGGHPHLWVYVDEQAGRWHPFAWAPSLAGTPPGESATPVRIEVGSGCADLRSAPRSAAAAIACLPGTQRVLTAGPDGQPWKAPVWDGKDLWWYVVTTGDNNGAPQGLDPPAGWLALRHLVCGQGPHGPICG